MSAIYRVVVWAVDNNGDGEAMLGDTEVVALNKNDARIKAHEELWDARLDSADCYAAYEVWKRLD